MAQEEKLAISRREFARRVAMISTAASLAPSNLLSTESPTTPLAQQQKPSAKNLSRESQAEVDSRIQAIFSQYGGRLSEVQKTDIRRLATEAQPPLDRLRAFAVENGDGPALYLKPLMEREAKSVAKLATPAATALPKKP
jgi:hypothetical protein